MRKSKVARWAVGTLVVAAFVFFGGFQLGGAYSATDVEWTAPPTVQFVR